MFRVESQGLNLILKWRIKLSQKYFLYVKMKNSIQLQITTGIQNTFSLRSKVLRITDKRYMI